MKKFEGKVILITGASSGIGRQAAIDFVNNGARDIILVGRSRSKLDQTKSTIESRCQRVLTLTCDVSNKENVIKMANDVLSTFSLVDILVNNAGYGLLGKVQDQSIEDIESIMATNYLGVVYCTKVLLNSMLKNKSGHIVNVASVAASFGVPGLAAYCASKYAVLGFSESLYHELAGTGVGITVVSPIAVRTNFFDNVSFDHSKRNIYYNRYALKPERVSKAIMSAASSHRLEIVVPFFVRPAIWLKQTLPFVVNPIVGTFFRRNLE